MIFKGAYFTMFSQAREEKFNINHHENNNRKNEKYLERVSIKTQATKCEKYIRYVFVKQVFDF